MVSRTVDMRVAESRMESFLLGSQSVVDGMYSGFIYLGDWNYVGDPGISCGFVCLLISGCQMFISLTTVCCVLAYTLMAAG